MKYRQSGLPYERQPGEPKRAYAAFAVYREMGVERSLAKAAKEIGRSVRVLEMRSVSWKWVERCQEYDAYLDRQARRAREKDRSIMLERHARLAMLGQSLVVDTLRKLLEEAQQDPTKKLSASDVSRLLEVSVKVERMSRGEPSEISELGGSANRPLRVSVEEMARKAVENALGIGETAAERTEPEETETEAQPEAAPDIPDPFAG